MTAGIEVDPAERKAIAADINLSVLKRSDPSISAVLLSASHVALYQLIDLEHKWRRCDVEGTLFIVCRTAPANKGQHHTSHPHAREPPPPNVQHHPYRLLISNRKSRDNYADDLVVGNTDIEQVDQMIMYCNSKRATVGVWFYRREEADAVFKLMTRIGRGDLPDRAPPPDAVCAARRPDGPSGPSAAAAAAIPAAHIDAGPSGGRAPNAAALPPPSIEAHPPPLRARDAPVAAAGPRASGEAAAQGGNGGVGGGGGGGSGGGGTATSTTAEQNAKLGAGGTAGGSSGVGAGAGAGAGAGGGAGGLERFFPGLRLTDGDRKSVV